MVPAPTRQADQESDKIEALRLAPTTTQQAVAAEESRNAAIRAARECGASLREIAQATGIPHMTVKRICERVESAS